MGFVRQGTIWRSKRPLYGLRESPRCWGTTRDKRLAELVVPGGLRFVRSPADHALWSIRRETEV
eukprot:5962656-Prorocentrum_lima.AAC.1